MKIHTSHKQGNSMKKVVLNGVDLSIEDVVKVARGGGAAGGAAEQGGAFP